jgi:ParB-like chromosome segregation protein Spo0J
MDLIKINKLKSNPTNPRVLRDEKFAKLKQSLTDFPDMLNKRPIVAVTDTDGKYMVLGGNMRLRACIDLKMKEVPVIIADEWTEEQRREFIIKDNVGFGEWSWEDLANEWDAGQLAEWGLDLPKDPLPSDDEQEDYSPGFRLVIECTNEAQQQQYFKEITNLGIECKPLTL